MNNPKLKELYARCQATLKLEENDEYIGSFIPTPEYSSIKTDCIVLFNQLKVDPVYISEIQKMGQQGAYEIETIMRFIESVDNGIGVAQGDFKEYDIFISHASADKKDYINDLEESFNRLGIKCFYDKKSIEWGDEWAKEIEDALASSEFAVIVISPNFFGREWTEKELYTLLDRRNSEGQKIILPILHNLTLNEIKDKYPSLAKIQMLNSADYSIESITIQLAKQLIKRYRR